MAAKAWPARHTRFLSPACTGGIPYPPSMHSSWPGAFIQVRTRSTGLRRSQVKAATVEVQALFERDIRYLIPIYQRNYRWNKEEHWTPIWDTVRAIAEDILDFGNGPDINGHFLGAIVCEQEESFGLDAH